MNPTPLFTACLFGLEDLIDDIEANTPGTIEWDQKNSLNQTGLYLAAATGHDGVVRKLIQCGADQHVQCPRRGTPLAAACFAGHLTTVRQLLRSGMTSNSTISSALQAAFRGGHEEVALCLLGHLDFSLEQDTYDSIFLGASAHGFVRVMRRLQRPDLIAAWGQKSPNTRLTKVIGSGNIEMLKRLTSNPVDPLPVLPPDGISTAALHGQDKMVLFLLDKGLNLETEGPLGSPLRVACLLNHNYIVHLLLNQSADVDACGSMGTALQAAAMKGHVQVAQLLLDRGAKVNVKGGPYGNPLQSAAYHGHVEMADLLLERGANIHQEGFSKDAFHAAAEGGHEEVVTLLLGKGYRPDEYVKPLYMACDKGHSAVVQMLLCYGADPNYSIDSKNSSYGRPNKIRGSETPLIIAARQGHLKTVRILLGVSRTACGQALSQASSFGHLAVIGELLSTNPDTASILAAFASACSNGQLQAIELLLETMIKFNPESKDKILASALQGSTHDKDV